MKNSSILCLLALAGCATTSPQVSELIGQELKDRLQHSAVSIRPVTSPAKLVERTKGQSVGNFLFASIVSSVAMSGTGARSTSEFQANTEIGQTFGQQLNTALPTGSEAEGGGSADTLLASRLSERFSVAPDLPTTPPVELTVSTIHWELGYESFLGSSDYSLGYEFEVRAVGRDADKPKTLKSVRCQGVAPEKMPLEAWQSDRYAAVGRAANEIADQCFQRTMRAFGLE
ncbi:MAG: hypothetical protein H6R17_1094 [Proteobacteria bacterium]|nr:hypothetical protein [Pseudomonadota bacterium]